MSKGTKIVLLAFAYQNGESIKIEYSYNAVAYRRLLGAADKAEQYLQKLSNAIVSYFQNVDIFSIRRNYTERIRFLAYKNGRQFYHDTHYGDLEDEYTFPLWDKVPPSWWSHPIQESWEDAPYSIELIDEDEAGMGFIKCHLDISDARNLCKAICKGNTVLRGGKCILHPTNEVFLSQWVGDNEE